MLGQGRRPGARPRRARAGRVRRRSSSATASAPASAARARWSSIATPRRSRPSRSGSSRLAAAGVRCELLEPEQARALEPGLGADLLGASYFPDDLQCDPRAIARAMAEEPGVRVRTGTRVERIVPGEGVRTADGTAARGRGRARRRAVERGARPRRRPRSAARAAQGPARAAARRAERAPQGLRQRLPRRRRGPRGRAAGLDRDRDDVGRRRARRLEPRAPGLRHDGRPRRHARDAGARGGR